MKKSPGITHAELQLQIFPKIGHTLDFFHLNSEKKVQLIHRLLWDIIMYLLNTSQLSNATVVLQVNGTAIRLPVDTQADIIILMERHLKECSILPCNPPG